VSFISDDLYRRIIECIPIACVDIAILSQDAIMLVKRKDPPAIGEWWLPGGRVLKGEMMQDTALRKAREEVGIDCRVGRIIHTAETIFPDGPYGQSIHSINSCFLLSPKDQHFQPRLDAHHDDYRWVKEIPAGLHPYVRICLKQAGLKPERVGDPDW
jgi:colanic acid biosynthesis protein WcaH